MGLQSGRGSYSGLARCRNWPLFVEALFHLLWRDCKKAGRVRILEVAVAVMHTNVLHFRELQQGLHRSCREMLPMHRFFRMHDCGTVGTCVYAFSKYNVLRTSKIGVPSSSNTKEQKEDILRECADLLSR